jgi:hypothetical protein
MQSFRLTHGSKLQDPRESTRRPALLIRGFRVRQCSRFSMPPVLADPAGGSGSASKPLGNGPLARPQHGAYKAAAGSSAKRLP